MVAGLRIDLTNVERWFGTRCALHPIDLSITPGQSVALMGPNGSGKSTLLRLSRGSVHLDGKEFTEDEEWVRRAVSVLPDDGAFYPDLTVREHLWLVAAAHGAGGETATLVDQRLEQSRLADHADEFPQKLSSGQAQQLLVSSTLIRPRQVLLLDEPERRLDPAARERLGDQLSAERAAGVTVVYATHHAELAAQADLVVGLRDGVVTAADQPSTLDLDSLTGDD
jgi:ABC-type multidrug transport system ATPase subunit